MGRDPRASGEWLEDALVEGIREGGGDALIAGVEPTPAIAFLTTDLGASSGVVISASHNPPEYNGIKFFDATGTKLPDDVEDEIEAAMGEPASRQTARAIRDRSATAGSATSRTSSRRPTRGSTACRS